MRIAGSPTDSFYLANLNTDLYSLSKVDSLRYKAMSCVSGNDILEVLESIKGYNPRHYVAVLKTLDSLYALASSNEDSHRIRKSYDSYGSNS
jgi:hypothetical protein